MTKLQMVDALADDLSVEAQVRAQVDRAPGLQGPGLHATR